MSDVDIQKLAELARVDVSDDKQTELEGDIEQVLEYVEQIQEVAAQKDNNAPDDPEAPEHRNVLREDDNAHARGEYSEEILNEAPNTEDGYVKVKKIL